MAGFAMEDGQNLQGSGKAEAGSPDARASARRSAPPANRKQKRALSVTRPLPVTKSVDHEGPTSWEFLSCGLDSLYLGVHVHWGDKWETLLSEFESEKLKARDKKNPPWRKFGAEIAFFFPAAREGFSFHFQTSSAHFFIVKTPIPINRTPNVYVELSAWAIWLLGVFASVELVQGVIVELGGRITAVVPSRFDLCADFDIPESVSQDFLKRHEVTLGRKRRPWEDGDDLETYYSGAGKSACQVRIYDKTKELRHTPSKSWMRNIWKNPKPAKAWRVEFQVRRGWLRNFNIHTVGSLLDQLGSIWVYLTSKTYSLRLLDDVNTSRRTIHPWWIDVQSCAEKFGAIKELQRATGPIEPPDVSQNLKAIRGHAISYGALRNHKEWWAVVEDLTKALNEQDRSDLNLELERRRQKFGMPSLEAQDYPKEWDEV